MPLRNVAIIAHVDHGKTTLVDQLLKQSGEIQSHQQVDERAMDSNDLERERGITILAKCTSVVWGDTRINIIDTPGHADFGGEVERILSMVDGVILLVDAAEGPMPQTKFVVGKALSRGLNPIVMVNKVDRSDARPHDVHDEVFDLFADLGANEHQLDFPTVFGSGRDGWASEAPDQPSENLAALFDLIVSRVPSPAVEQEGTVCMMATLLENDNFLGRILTGRIERGTLKQNMTVKILTREGEVREQGRISKLLAFRGLSRVPVAEANAGDIVAVAGLKDATVSDTIGDPTLDAPLESLPVDPPTLSITVAVNDGPLAGREGSKVTSRVIRDRLMREAEGNIALKITESADKDSFDVAGRGELQLAVLVETMRREGFEMCISRPKVLMQTDPDTSQTVEPIEELVVDVDEEFSGSVVQKLSERKAELIEMKQAGAGKQRLRFLCPARGLIGYHGEFMTDTRGTGVMNRVFHSWAPFKGAVPGRRNGVLISNADGEAVAYALFNLEDRGIMMVEPQTPVYQGMIVGEHSRENDLEVNVLKAKQLTNVRASGKDETIRLTPPLLLSLEKAISYINDDEMVEVTPESIRLRKKMLCPHERKRAERAEKRA